MNARRDEFLKSVFERAEQSLDDPRLAESVLARARRRRLIWLGAGLAGAVALSLVAWLALGTSLLHIALLASETMTNPILDLGESWLTLLLMPLNSLGGLLAIATKAGLTLRKRLLSGSFGA